MARRKSLLCLLFLACAAPAAADGNGRELLGQCEQALVLLDGGVLLEAQARADAAWCLGFVRGVTGVVSSSYFVKPYGQPFCPPHAGIDPQQAVRELVEYLRAHPRRLHAGKVTLATAAFMHAYPCGPGAAPDPFGFP